MILGFGSAFLIGCLLAIAAGLPVIAYYNFSNRRRFEERAATREWIQALEAQSTDAVLTVDAANVILAVNPAVQRLFGYSDQELVGSPLSAILPAAGRWPSTAGSEVEARRKDGTHFPAQLSIREIETFGPPVFRAFVRDLTDRQRAETLHREVRFISDVVEHAGAAIVIVDQEGVIVRANRAFHKMIDCTPGEVLGRYFWEVLLEPDAWAAAKNRLAHLVASGSAKDTTATSWRGPGGQHHNVAMVATPLPNPQGTPEFAILVAMENLVPQAAVAPAAPVTTVAGSEPAERLAAGVARQFNELLTAINGYADLLLHLMEEKEPLRRDVEQIKNAGERAAGLTSQLLAFSRKQQLRPQVLLLNELIADRKDTLRMLIGENIQLSTVLDMDLGWLRVDPSWMEQVLLELVANARDAMPEGGKLTIETSNLTMEDAGALPGTPKQEFISLAVIDTGVGIAEEAKNHLFEPFFSTKGSRGVGLGLASIRGVVEQSGGNIAVDSVPGKGTRVRVLLPRVTHVEQQPMRNTVTKALYLVKGAGAGGR